MTKPYPDYAYRGISDKNQIFFEEDTVSQSAFQFAPNEGRSDYLECSINWADDEGSLIQLANQRSPRRPDAPQFSAGACRLSRSRIELAKVLANAHTSLCYERSPLEGNPYHGNLLCKADASKKLLNCVSGALSLAVDQLISRDTLDQYLIK